MPTDRHGLRPELKLRDLVFMQIVLIFSLQWTGFAAKQGSTQLLLWLIAVALFYLPLAAVVMKLSRAMPVEGGVYQWTKEGLSPLAGYMAGWCITVYAVFAFASTGSALANGFAWVAGPSGAWMTTSKPFAMALTAGFCLLAWFLNARGLHLAKWFSAATSVVWFAMFALLLFLLFRGWALRLPRLHESLSLAWPSLSLVTIGVLAKMAMGALSGFDNSAIFADECRKPENDVARSVMIAGPMIAIMYVVGTSALLVYTPPAQIDVAAAIPQAIRAGFGSRGLGAVLSVGTVAVFSLAAVISEVIFVGAVARLPMVAGWDGLLPAWWSELHPRFRTPSKAIGAVTAAIALMGAFSLWGASNQEAYEVASSIGVASLCIMYMLLFSVILFGFRSRASRPGAVIRLGALAAFTVAFVSLILQILPLGDVANPWIFAGKVSLAICAAQGLGAWLYFRGTKRKAALPAI